MQPPASFAQGAAGKVAGAMKESAWFARLMQEMREYLWE